MDQAPPRNLKPHLSFAEQLSLLKSRGLKLADEVTALSDIQRLGYYRLAGYFYPLRKTRPVGERGRLDSFQNGSTFELVVQLAEFDKKLRLLALHALETIEIAVRVRLAYRLGALDPEAHLNPRLLDGRFTQKPPHAGRSPHEVWLERFEDLCAKSREDFLQHHRQSYGGRMPIWVAIELWDFGLLSRFVAGLQHRDRNAMAVHFGLTDGAVLKSWMRTFNFVRNVCAHHSRLWNRRLPEIPVLPPLERCRWLEVLHKNEEGRSKIFGALTCMRWMMRSMAPASAWTMQLKALVETFPQSALVSIRAAGFPDGWAELPIWRE